MNCHPTSAIGQASTLPLHLFLAILLSGCAPNEVSDKDALPAEPTPTETAPGDAVEGAAPPGDAVEGAATPDGLELLVFLARGNEPFWNVRIYPDRLRFSALGEDPIEFLAPDDRSEPETGRWIWSAEGDSGAFSVTIEHRPCDDTMADVSYEYAANVRFQGRVVEGCAIKGSVSG
jgi:uncharacterized membrane protein